MVARWYIEYRRMPRRGCDSGNAEVRVVLRKLVLVRLSSATPRCDVLVADINDHRIASQWHWRVVAVGSPDGVGLSTTARAVVAVSWLHRRMTRLAGSSHWPRAYNEPELGRGLVMPLGAKAAPATDCLGPSCSDSHTRQDTLTQPSHTLAQRCYQHLKVRPTFKADYQFLLNFNQPNSKSSITLPNSPKTSHKITFPTSFLTTIIQPKQAVSAFIYKTSIYRFYKCNLIFNQSLITSWMFSQMHLNEFEIFEFL